LAFKQAKVDETVDPGEYSYSVALIAVDDFHFLSRTCQHD
jgi:hypothetical protein